jgi:hypothetical protein
MSRAEFTAHDPAPALVNPAEHWHSALPEEDSELAGHVSHTTVPKALLNVPAAHALHATPPEAAVYPGRHIQSVKSLLPSDETVFEGHAAQVIDPVVALYLAVKPARVSAPSDVNRTCRCCPVAVYVASAGAPLSFASSTTPDEHAAFPHSSTYT